MKRMPLMEVGLLVWSIFITSILILTAFPVLGVAFTLLLFDRNFNTSFYDGNSGGDSLLFQTLLWITLHPVLKYNINYI